MSGNRSDGDGVSLSRSRWPASWTTRGNGPGNQAPVSKTSSDRHRRMPQVLNLRRCANCVPCGSGLLSFFLKLSTRSSLGLAMRGTANIPRGLPRRCWRRAWHVWWVPWFPGGATASVAAPADEDQSHTCDSGGTSPRALTACIVASWLSVPVKSDLCESLRRAWQASGRAQSDLWRMPVHTIVMARRLSCASSITTRPVTV